LYLFRTSSPFQSDWSINESGLLLRILRIVSLSGIVRYISPGDRSQAGQYCFDWSMLVIKYYALGRIADAHHRNTAFGNI